MLVVLGHREPGISAEHRISAESRARLRHARASRRAGTPVRAAILTGYTSTGGLSEAEQMKGAWDEHDAPALLEVAGRNTAENASRSLPLLLALGEVRRVDGRLVGVARAGAVVLRSVPALRAATSPTARLFRARALAADARRGAPGGRQGTHRPAVGNGGDAAPARRCLRKSIPAYGVTTNPVFVPGNVEPRYSEFLTFVGISVDDGDQHYLDSQIAYRRARLERDRVPREVRLLARAGLPAARRRADRGPLQRRRRHPQTGAATLYLPTAIFDFDISPSADGPQRADRGSCAMTS